jgi:DNA-binding beta-propeller fold protein YncE
MTMWLFVLCVLCPAVALQAQPRLRVEAILPLEYPDFVDPIAIAAGPLGQLFLADVGRNTVVRIDTLLNMLYEFEAPEDQLEIQPYDIAVSGFQVYVIDAASNTLLRFTDTGAFLDVLRSFREERIETPRAVDIDPAGRVLLVNEARHTGRVLDETQQEERLVGGFGSRHGELSAPSGGAFAPDGSFFLSDTGNRRVQHFSRVGNLEPSYFAGIEEPRGMCTGPYGGLWVTDAAAPGLHWYAPSSLQHAFLELPEMRPIDVCILGNAAYVLSSDPPALIRVRVLRGE